MKAPEAPVPFEITPRALAIGTVLAMVLTGFTVWAWDPRPTPEPHVERGNASYAQRRYPEALAEYENAPGAGPRHAGVHLDRGLARYRTAIPPDDGGALVVLPIDASVPEPVGRAQEELRTAGRGGTTSAAEEVEAQLRAAATYDVGDTWFAQHSWDNAIEAYKEALRLRPGWNDAAWNLALARVRKEQERERPDAGPDAQTPDASQPDAQRPEGGTPDAGQPDAGGQDGGGQDGGNPGQDGGASGDGGQPGNDGGAGGRDGGSNGGQDGGAPPPRADAGTPRSLAPLDDLDRSTRNLWNDVLRRRGAAPRTPDDDR